MPVLKRCFTIYVCLILLFFSLQSQANNMIKTIDQAFDNHPVTMLLIDPATGEIKAANQAASEYYGYSKNKLVTMRIQQINVLSPEAIAAERELVRKENRNYFIFRHRLANGSIRTVKVSSAPVSVEPGKQLLFSLITDINNLRSAEDNLWHYQNRLEEMVDQQMARLHAKEFFIYSLLGVTILSLISTAITLGYLLYRRRQSAQKIYQEKERLNDIIWGTHAGTWAWEIVSGRIHINDRWAEMLGYTRDELEPLSLDLWMDLAHPEDIEQTNAKIAYCLAHQGHAYENEVRMRHKLGNWVWVLDRGRIAAWDESGNPLKMCGTRQDISQEKKVSLQLEHMALYDQLTNLANRTLFYNHLKKTLANAPHDPSQFALMFIDLDGFKQVNDQHGHHIGDDLLIEVATRLQNAIRHSDTCARMGGDEFAVLLYHIEEMASVSIIAEHILTNLRLPFDLGLDQPIHISCSIGISLYPENSKNGKGLVQQADNAMYEAKKSGKNSYVFAR
jgi:diguanylate cyclase (GGDEF)-like protein/PAS domain S-box-containing protein